jgi:hypothetical protein
MYILVYIDLPEYRSGSKFSPSYGPFENEKQAIQFLIKKLIKNNILSHDTYLDIIETQRRELEDSHNPEEEEEEEEEEKEEKELYAIKFFSARLEKKEDFEQFLYEECNNFSDVLKYVELIGVDYTYSWDCKIINTDYLTLSDD